MEGHEMSNSSIPSDEDFARAKKLTRERSRNIDVVNENVFNHFKNKCPLHYFILMPQRDNEFWAVVFYQTDEDVALCEKNGTSDEIRRFVYDALEKHGRGKREVLQVSFEFDSDENVRRKFDGDYFLRLR
jgi:hypothetical protein